MKIIKYIPAKLFVAAMYELIMQHGLCCEWFTKTINNNSMSQRWIWEGKYPTNVNGVIVLSNSLNSKILKYEIWAKKARKSERNKKKLDEDAMLCNTLWSDRCRLIAKNFFLPFHVLLNVGIDPDFLQKKSFFYLALFRGKFCFPAKTFFKVSHA